MKFVHYQDCKSPHQLPLARELVKSFGSSDFRFIYRDRNQSDRKALGWGMGDADEPWMQWMGDGDSWRKSVEGVEMLLTGFREIDLFERRQGRGLMTFYQSERWFKPITIVRLFGLFDCSIPGWVRMLVPSYRRMAKRFVRWMNSDPNARCLTIGPWAKKDMLRIGVDESKIVPWGYFVAPSAKQSNNQTIEQSNNLKVLWVGRMVYLKRVDTIVRAVCEVEKRGGGGQRKIQLTLVGDGPEKPRLQRLAARMLRKVDNSTVNLNHQPQPDTITFLPVQPIDKIREIMREHDVFVFASTARDGWGAVVSEALEEGMVVIGTHETGASATMLSEEWRFHAGDWRRLAMLLERCAEMKRIGTLQGEGIGEWSAEKAAERLLAKLI